MKFILKCVLVEFRLSDETKRDEAVKHALAVRAAVTSGNYVLFFRLYKTAPNLNTCLMGEYKVSIFSPLHCKILKAELTSFLL